MTPRVLGAIGATLAFIGLYLGARTGGETVPVERSRHPRARRFFGGRDHDRQPARGEPVNPRRIIVLTCSILLVLLGLFIAFGMQTIPAVIIGLVMAVSGVSSFAKTI